MTFARVVFAFALLMLGAGIASSRYLFGPIFESRGPATLISAAPVKKAAEPTATQAQPTATTGATTLSHPTVRPTAIPTVRPTVHPRVRKAARVMPRPRVLRRRHVLKPTATSLPQPTSTPMTGTVALARYWVGSVQARRGQTVEVGYVINNGTGHWARVVLGASIKGTTTLSWVSGSVSDPSHDVVAIVPPGISTHIRYFTLPTGIRPGAYDTAWGLRDARTGRREALVTAPGVLKVKP